VERPGEKEKRRTGEEEKRRTGEEENGRRVDSIANPRDLVIPAEAGTASPSTALPPENFVIPAEAGTASPGTALPPENFVIPAEAETASPGTALPPERFHLRNITLHGDPWKAGIGYEYLSIIQPDTGKGSYRGFNIRLSKKVSNRLWFGTGLTIGKIDLIEVSKNWVQDWTRTDSLGTIYLRDSTTSEHRWQNHLAIPLTLIFDLYRNRRIALPLQAGTTIGLVYGRGHADMYDGRGIGSQGGFPNTFTYFITADLSFGYEMFYYRNFSATLSAEYRRVLTGRNSFGFGENFIGVRVLINLDFDERKW
jgi:hypothetical protein